MYIYNWLHVYWNSRFGKQRTNHADQEILPTPTVNTTMIEHGRDHFLTALLFSINSVTRICLSFSLLHVKPSLPFHPLHLQFLTCYLESRANCVLGPWYHPTQIITSQPKLHYLLISKLTPVQKVIFTVKALRHCMQTLMFLSPEKGDLKSIYSSLSLFVVDTSAWFAIAAI